MKSRNIFILYALVVFSTALLGFFVWQFFGKAWVPRSVDRFKTLSLEEQKVFIQGMLDKEGPFKARTFILEAFPTQPNIKHDLMHMVGESLYSLYGGSALLACDQSFVFACHHGVVVEHIRSKGLDKKELVNFVSEGCQGAADRTYAFHACVHGMGHALMLVNRNDLPESLRDCSDFLSGKSLKNACYRGVFMEHVMNSFSEAVVPGSYVSRDDPYVPCRMLALEYQPSCYAEYLTHFLNERYPEDWAKAAEYCFNIPDATLDVRHECFRQIGVALDGFTNGNIEEASLLCSNTSAYQKYCIYGFAGQRLFSGGREQAYRACEKLPSEEGSWCFKEIEVLDMRKASEKN